MSRLEHFLSPAVLSLSRVPEVSDLAPAELQDYQAHDQALTSERALARIQLCIDFDVPLRVRPGRRCGLMCHGASVDPSLRTWAVWCGRLRVWCVQIVPLLDDSDADVRACALRIVCAVLASACDISAVVGISAVPRLADADDKTVDAVITAALARIREDDSENPSHSLRWVCLPNVPNWIPEGARCGWRLSWSVQGSGRVGWPVLTVLLVVAVAVCM